MSDRIRVLIPIGISLPCMFLCVASVYFANLPRVSPILQASVPLASEFYLVDIRDSLLKSHMYLVVSQLIPHWKFILLLSLSPYRSPSRVSVVLVVLVVASVVVAPSRKSFTRRCSASGVVIFLSGSCRNLAVFPRRYFGNTLGLTRSLYPLGRTNRVCSFLSSW